MINKDSKEHNQTNNDDYHMIKMEDNARKKYILTLISDIAEGFKAHK